MHVRGRKSLSVLVAVSLLGAVASTVAASPASADPPVTVVVSYDQIAPLGPWAEGADTGSFAFRAGPGTPPGGTGSLELVIASGQHEWLENFDYGACATTPACNDEGAKTPIADLDALSYSTYRASGSTMPSFNIETHTTGTGGYTSLAFVPANGLVTNSTWQTWDTMDPGDGVWYSSRDLNNGGLFDCAPFSCSASWAQIVTAFPNGKIAFGLGPNVGTGGTFNGNIDNFTVGVAGATSVFDFERVECTTVCIVDAVTGDDAGTGTPGYPLRTIQAGIAKVSPGGEVQLSAGTFTENVVVNKTVHIQGSGPGTVVVPAASNPNCGGLGGGSLCAGASNVFLVAANGVEIDQLTVDGDNPALSGVSVGGANVDARNGIITNHPGGVFNGLSVHDVTVENVFLRGIYASSAGTFDFTNNTIDNVQGDAASIGIFNFGGAGTITGNDVSNTNDGIAANHSKGTQLTNNTVTASGSGVHSDNAGDSGGTPDLLSGNNVSACTNGGYGVWTFVAYIAPTVSNNTVSGCAVGLGAFASCNLAGTNNCPGDVVPTVTFTGNQVTGVPGGKNFHISTTSFGFGDGDVKVNAHHNTLTGGQIGVNVEETGAGIATVTANRNNVSGNSLRGVRNAGATPVNAQCNWWGQASGPNVGQAAGSVQTGPWIITSDLDGNCIPIMKVGQAIRGVDEGNSGTTAVTLTVSLDRASNLPASVEWETVSDTADTSDYTAASGTLNWAPGELFQQITVDVKGDVTLEDFEQFKINLHDNTGAILANNTKRVEILNDDKPTLIAASVSVTEGSPATFIARLSHRYFQPITITVSSANGTATAPGDYTAVPGGTTLIIPTRSNAAAPLSVPTNVDGLVEGFELFTVTFGSPSIGNDPRTATVAILANNT